jgi:hypothetical protein
MAGDDQPPGDTLPDDTGDVDGKVDPWPRVPIAASLASTSGALTAIAGTEITDSATEGSALLAPIAADVMVAGARLPENLLSLVGELATLTGGIVAIIGAGYAVVGLLQQIRLAKRGARFITSRNLRHPLIKK